MKKIVWDYPSDLDYGGDRTPPEAKDWFFVLTTGRTGSTVFTEILNLHKDIYCGNEQNVFHLLSVVFKSGRIYAKDPTGKLPSLRYISQHHRTLDTLGLRALMEAWRGTQSGAKMFGDKDWLYGEDYAVLCEKVFPRHKKILSVRGILDQLSSLYSQGWYRGFPSQASSRRAHILKDVKCRIEYNSKWEREADLVVRFEDFSSQNGVLETLSSVFKVLGIDFGSFNMAKALSLCRHMQSLGRWKKDPVLLDFIKWLKTRDVSLASKLETGYTS